MKVIFEGYFNFIVTVASLIVVISQWYLENIEGLVPCNLCLLQKFSAQAIFLIYLFKMVTPKLKVLFDVVGVGFVLFGLSAGLRQVYLQNLPKDELPLGLCDMPFEAIFSLYPFFEGLQKVFLGSSKCAEEQWWFLGFNIAEWSSIFFSSILVIMLVRYFLIMFKGHKYN